MSDTTVICKGQMLPPKKESDVKEQEGLDPWSQRNK